MANCPDGRCDGSGFLYDEAAPQGAAVQLPACHRLARKRAAALEGRIPRRYREVSIRARAADLEFERAKTRT